MKFKAFVDTNIIIDCLLERNITKDTINEAISSGIKDFEDAVQIIACKQEKIDLIITRNKKDFKNQWIQIRSPEEYLENPSALTLS